MSDATNKIIEGASTLAAELSAFGVRCAGIESRSNTLAETIASNQVAMQGADNDLGDRIDDVSARVDAHNTTLQAVNATLAEMRRRLDALEEAAEDAEEPDDPEEPEEPEEPTLDPPIVYGDERLPAADSGDWDAVLPHIGGAIIAHEVKAKQARFPTTSPVLVWKNGNMAGDSEVCLFHRDVPLLTCGADPLLYRGFERQHIGIVNLLADSELWRTGATEANAKINDAVADGAFLDNWVTPARANMLANLGSKTLIAGGKSPAIPDQMVSADTWGLYASAMIQTTNALASAHSHMAVNPGSIDDLTSPWIGKLGSNVMVLEEHFPDSGAQKTIARIQAIRALGARRMILHAYIPPELFAPSLALYATACAAACRTDDNSVCSALYPNTDGDVAQSRRIMLEWWPVLIEAREIVNEWKIYKALTTMTSTYPYEVHLFAADGRVIVVGLSTMDVTVK